MALVQQILKVIGCKYLTALRKCITGKIPSKIRALILHLFRVYGIIIPQQLRAKYESIEPIEYAIEESISIIFYAIEDLQEISELAGRPFSQAQIIDLGHMAVATNRIFRGNVIKWMRRPKHEKS